MMLIDKVRQGITNAPEAAEVRRITRLRNRLQKQLRLGVISPQEYQEQINLVPLPNLVEIEDPNIIYDFFLDYLGQSPELARKNADHELAHYWKARELGCNRIRFGFLFYKETLSDDSIHYFCDPRVMFDLPVGIDDHTAKQIIEQVFSAPGILSKSDKEILNNHDLDSHQH